jgi:glycosyltransferase XagB
MAKEFIDGLLVIVSVLVTVQSAHALYLTLYTWDRPKVDAHAPDTFSPPSLSFTVMLPARHEESVIQATIDRVARANYPAHLIQVLVICSADDVGTIDKAEEKLNELRRRSRVNASMVVFDDGPVNKPHGLNCGLALAVEDVITVFDAEDDIHEDIFNVINTVMLDEGVKVVQSGVQLMDFDANWYSSLNVLEYFFWFKSRLHYYSRLGAIPLGGNTVFFERELIARIGGWDEQNLTEDADIGLRLSAAGERIRVVYDDRYVTKEETPPTLDAFIRQRTRWSQGFMQTLRKGVWRELPTRRQRWLACYTLGFPQAQALLAIYVPLSLLMMLVFKTPVLVALISYLPVAMLFAHYLTSVVGLYEFTGAHGLQASPKAVLHMALAWFPYQLLISYASLRAVRRQMQGVHNWEKTQHIGAHRVGLYDGAVGQANDNAA